MATGYVTPEEFIQFYDPRRVCELLSVTGTPVSVGDLDDPSSDGYKKLVAAFILPCAADIDAACQVGRRYARTDLEFIIDDAAANPDDPAKQKRASYLKRLNADLSFGELVSSRGYAADAMTRMAPRYEQAQSTVEQLNQGVRILDMDTVMDAGVPSIVTIGSHRIMSTEFNKLFGVWAGPFWENTYGY